MKIFQKFIATITILALLLSPVFNFISFRPKQVKALDGGGSWAQAIKDTILDAIGWAITDQIIKPLEQKIINWGMGRSTDSNQPFPVLDWGRFFKEILDVASAKFINKFQLTPLCAPIKISLGTRPEFSWYYSDLDYQYMAACTLGDVVDNVEEFFKNPKIGFYGSDAWLELTRPQNNIYGSWLMAWTERQKMLAEEERNADKETGVSDGVKNETVTTKTDLEACKAACEDQSNQSCIDKCGGRAATSACVEECLKKQKDECLEKCEVNSGGFAIEKKVKNLGADIHEQLNNAMSADMQRLISADEITELIGVIFSALINRAINGLGLMFSQQTATQVERNRAERRDNLSYQRQFKKAQTPEDIQNVRSQTLTNILKSMQQLSRSIIACKGEEMMKVDDYSKNLADILAANVEGLYIGLDGVNLKPDFEVLDSQYAPYTVYGYSWGEVPARKIPDKCREIANQYLAEVKKTSASLNATCRTIISRLEPRNPTGLGFAYTGNCDQCMYDHSLLNCPPGALPPQPYPSAGQPDPFANETIIKRKEAFWWDCKNRYNLILGRCDDCLKKVDEKCDQTDPMQKNQCISNQCNNYGDTNQLISPLNPLPADLPTTPYNDTALEFYNRCLIEERKDACYTCLKEYFMPAFYCDETKDYMARSIVKYPAVVLLPKDASKWWYALGILPGLIADWLTDDKGMFIGLYDAGIAKREDKCDDNAGKQNINLSLICRIMPDFSFGGKQVCRTTCFQKGMTEEQLQNIADFRPHNLDCGGVSLDVGGREPFDLINGGVYRMLGKCCGTFWVHDEEKYAVCVGSGETGEEEEPEPRECDETQPKQTPWCHCPEGFRPLLGQRTRTGDTEPGKAPLGGDCINRKFDNDGRPLFVYTNIDPLQDVYYISKDSYCTEKCEAINNTNPNFTHNYAPVPYNTFWASTGCSDITCRCEIYKLGYTCPADSAADPPPNIINTNRCPTDAIPPTSTMWTAEPPGYYQRGWWCLDGSSSSLPEIQGSNLNIGIYHNDNTDGPRVLGEETGSGLNLCAPCYPTDGKGTTTTDDDYPYYGVKDKETGEYIDQCHGKNKSIFLEQHENCGGGGD